MLCRNLPPGPEAQGLQQGRAQNETSNRSLFLTGLGGIGWIAEGVRWCQAVCGYPTISPGYVGPPRFFGPTRACGGSLAAPFAFASAASLPIIFTRANTCTTFHLLRLYFFSLDAQPPLQCRHSMATCGSVCRWFAPIALASWGFFCWGSHRANDTDTMHLHPPSSPTLTRPILARPVGLSKLHSGSWRFSESHRSDVDHHPLEQHQLIARPQPNRVSTTADRPTLVGLTLGAWALLWAGAGVGSVARGRWWSWSERGSPREPIMSMAAAFGAKGDPSLTSRPLHVMQVIASDGSGQGKGSCSTGQQRMLSSNRPGPAPAPTSSGGYEAFVKSYAPRPAPSGPPPAPTPATTARPGPPPSLMADDTRMSYGKGSPMDGPMGNRREMQMGPGGEPLEMGRGGGASVVVGRGAAQG